MKREVPLREKTVTHCLTPKLYFSHTTRIKNSVPAKTWQQTKICYQFESTGAKLPPLQDMCTLIFIQYHCIHRFGARRRRVEARIFSLSFFRVYTKNCFGKGKDPLLRHSLDGDILARIIKVLRERVDHGLFTIFIKIRAHRGEFLSEKADRWADEGRDDVDNVRWDGPSLHPTFSWTNAGVNNFISRFLNREDNIRDLLRKHWQDKTVPDRSKRHLLQSICSQFPCAKLLKLWGIREDDDFRLCKRPHPDVTPWAESLGHIQTQKPRIAVHHCVWRELLS